MMRDPLALTTPLWADLYALTMAQVLFDDGRHMEDATFHAFVRTAPYGGMYFVAAGQGIFADWLSDGFGFTPDVIAFLQQTGRFSAAFLAMLEQSACALDVDAMAEGEVAFAGEPVYRVRGPLWQGLLVEAALLNTLNSQSLFATQAARLLEASGGASVVEFGVRRAHDIGGLAATRGAFVGGIAGTSNLEAARVYGIPVSGTFAHALVMAYEDEVAAFDAYAKTYGDASIFLVDTYDSLRAVERMIAVCQKRSIKPFAIRLDSGDLTWLSRKARKKLDAAGFKDTKIVATNDLDALTIMAIRAEGGAIDLWGVGTSLVTGGEHPALGAVYKLADVNGRPVMKLSEQPSKTTLPTAQTIRRYVNDQGMYAGDVIVPSAYTGEAVVSVRPDDETRRKPFAAGQVYETPLQPVFRAGRRVLAAEPLSAARDRCRANLARVEPSHRRLLNPHRYVVGVESGLHALQKDLAARLIGQ